MLVSKHSNFKSGSSGPFHFLRTVLLITLLGFAVTACSSGGSGSGGGGDDGSNGGSDGGSGDGGDGGGDGGDGGVDDPDTYPVGGTLTGLVRGDITLSLNDDLLLTVDSDGSFLFPDELEEGETYEVELVDHAMGQACVLSGGQGAAGSESADAVGVDCHGLALEAVGGDRTVALSWEHEGLVDILYSSDHRCDWVNISSCENSGHLSQIDGGALTLSSHGDELLDDAPYTFVLAQSGGLSLPAYATPIRHSVGGTPWDAVRHEDRVFIGGNLSTYGSRAVGVATYYNHTPEIRLAGPVLDLQGSSPQVSAKIVDPVGGWFMAGNWDEINDHSQANITRLNVDGSIDTEWQADIQGRMIYDMIHHQERLYIGGRFDSVEGDAGHQNLAALDLDGKLIEAFNSSIPNGDVYHMLAHGDRLYIVGSFSDYGSAQQTGVVALDTETGAVVDTFSATTDGPVRDLLLRDDTLYIAGEFEQVNGQDRAYLAALDRETGTLETDFVPDVDNEVWALYMHADDLFIGGYFTEVMGERRRGLARIDRISGALNEHWEPPGQRWANHISSDGEFFYIAGVYPEGPFGRKSGYRRYEIASGDWDESWMPDFDDILFANESAWRTFVHGDQVTLGGRFESPGYPIDHLIALDFETETRDTDWRFGTNATIRSLLIDEGTLFVGGEFTGIYHDEDWTSRRSGAAFDLATDELLPWNPHTGARINVIGLNEDGLYLGGTFNQVNDGNCLQPHFALVDRDTGDCVPGSGLDALNISGHVETLTPAPGFAGESGLILTGSFNEIAGDAVRGHAVLNADSHEVIHRFETVRDRAFNALAYSDKYNYQFVGGAFEAINGEERFGFFGYSDDTELDLSAPEAGFYTRVRSLVLDSDDDRLLVGGNFRFFGGQSRSRFAAMAFDGENFLHLDGVPTFDSTVTAIKRSGDHLLVLGHFDHVNDVFQRSFVILDAETLEPI